MNMKKRVVAVVGMLVTSTAAIAYDTEREYLLDLYHDVDSKTVQLSEHKKSSSQSEILLGDLVNDQRTGLDNGLFLTPQTPR